MCKIRTYHILTFADVIWVEITSWKTLWYQETSYCHRNKLINYIVIKVYTPTWTCFDLCNIIIDISHSATPLQWQQHIREAKFISMSLFILYWLIYSESQGEHGESTSPSVTSENGEIINTEWGEWHISCIVFLKSLTFGVIAGLFWLLTLRDCLRKSSYSKISQINL